MGRQVHLKVSAKDYYLDLLFYHEKIGSVLDFILTNKELAWLLP